MAVDKNAANLKSWFRKLFKIMPARDIGVNSPIRLQNQIFRTGSDRAKKRHFGILLAPKIAQETPKRAPKGIDAAA